MELAFDLCDEAPLMSTPNQSHSQGRVERLTVSGRACIRCRQKKKRCDQKLPKCRLCEQAGVECLGYDATAVRQVPRSYIHDLEERIAYLEQKLQECSAQTHNDPLLLADPPSIPVSLSPAGRPPGFVTAEAQEDISSSAYPGPSTRSVAATAASSVLNLSAWAPGREPAFSKIFLTDIMRNMIKPQILRSQPFSRPGEEESPFHEIIGDLQEVGPVALPSRETAKQLASMYFHLTNLGMPLLHEKALQEKLDLLYNLPQKIDLASTHVTIESRMAAFFVLEVFAIALLVVQAREPSGGWLADRYHKTALAALHEAGLPSDIEGVQALLLIGQHAYHHPTLWNVWKIVGAALRLAVELRLHQDPPSDMLSFFDLDHMRRTFWVAYAMDRNVSTSLYLPCCLSDGAITAKFPSDARDEHITPDASGHFLQEQISCSKRITLHLYRYRQIQSETWRALHEEPFLPTEASSLSAWQHQMHAKIEGWFQTTPQDPNFTKGEKDVIETFELTYNTALFNLYRPSPNILSPSGPQLLAMTQAGTKMIHLYRRFFRQSKLTIYWQAVENVSSVGLALLYGFIQAQEVRESMTLFTLNSLVHLCSSLLWGMVENFPSLKGKRDAFDAASSQVLTDLNEGLPTSIEGLGLLEPNGTSWTARSIDQRGSGAVKDARVSNVPDVTAAPDDLLMRPGLASGVGLGTNIGDTPFSLTDYDIQTWMLEPAEGIPGTLPMTWM